MTDPRYLLRPPRSAAEWRVYHAIRKTAIFAVHLPGEIYDEDDPDESAPDNLPHVFLRDGEIVGTVRIDWIDAERAGFRLIAIRPDLQNRGLGGEMMALAEQIARAHGRREAVINAHPKAVTFYLNLGYARGDWRDRKPVPVDLIRVGKVLAAGGAAGR